MCLDGETVCTISAPDPCRKFHWISENISKTRRHLPGHHRINRKSSAHRHFFSKNISFYTCCLLRIADHICGVLYSERRYFDKMQIFIHHSSPKFTRFFFYGIYIRCSRDVNAIEHGNIFHSTVDKIATIYKNLFFAIFILHA